MSAAVDAPPRGRTTDELIALMNKHTTQTSAHWIIGQLERAGWITCDDDDHWRATPVAVAWFGGITWTLDS